jgi:hypothetical protein
MNGDSSKYWKHRLLRWSLRCIAPLVALFMSGHSVAVSSPVRPPQPIDRALEIREMLLDNDARRKDRDNPGESYECEIDPLAQWWNWNNWPNWNNWNNWINWGNWRNW